MPRAVEAPVQTSLTLRPRPPFHFAGTVHKPSRFPARCVAYERATYWQALRWRGRVLGVRMRGAGTRAHPRIGVTLYSRRPLGPSYVESVACELRWRFDLDSDLTGFCECYGDDPVLAPSQGRWAGMRGGSPYSLHEYLVGAVVLQNATVRRSVSMLQALFETYRTAVRFDDQELFVFWPPERLARTTEQELRALKVGYRATALMRVASAFSRHEVDELAMRGMDREAARKELSRLYGMGPASVWGVLFAVFHHYDAFDVISPWEQKIFSRLIFGKELVPGERVLREVKRRWGPWRMLASHYVFEDLFWQHQRREIPWLRDLIRL